MSCQRVQVRNGTAIGLLAAEALAVSHAVRPLFGLGPWGWVAAGTLIVASVAFSYKGATLSGEGAETLAFDVF